MSENFWQDDEVEETNAMRVLREKAEADSALIREMRDELSALRKERKEENLDAAIKAKNLDPKVKDLIPDGKSLEDFLADYGSLLGAQTNEANTDSEDDGSAGDNVPDDEAAARAAVAGAASQAKATAGLDATEAKMNSFDNPEDLIAWLQTQ